MNTPEEPWLNVTCDGDFTRWMAAHELSLACTTYQTGKLLLLGRKPDYLAALPVVPLIASAFAIQGVYQLTSIGLNLTSRTEFYPVSTVAAATISVAVGLWLIPTYGLMGAALTVLASYATQATVAFVLAQRVYHVHYEGPRLIRIVIAGVVAALAGLALPALPPLVGLLARAATTVATYAGLLWMTGFLRASERQFLTEMRLRWKQRRAARGTDHAR